MKKLNNGLGDALIEYRALNNLTQAQLASKIGVSRQTVWIIENNERKVSKKILIKIAYAIGLKRKEEE